MTKGNATLSLTQDVTVTTSLTLSTGFLQTGSNKVVLGPTATLSETDLSYLAGNIEPPRTLGTAGSSNTFGGMGLTLTPDAASTALPGSTLVRRVTGSPATGVSGHTGIGRYFIITPTVNAGLNVVMIFNYFLHELNGLALRRAYRNSGIEERRLGLSGSLGRPA